MKAFTPEELLARLERRREIRNVMGRVSHDYAVKQEAEVFGRYWSGREDVSLMLNAGGYRGAAAVKGYYDALGEEIALSSKLIQKKFPEALGDKTEEEILGVGMITYLPFESQVIEIADDGKTAKAGKGAVRRKTAQADEVPEPADQPASQPSGKAPRKPAGQPSELDAEMTPGLNPQQPARRRRPAPLAGFLRRRGKARD